MLVLEEPGYFLDQSMVLKLLWTTKQVGKIFENSPQKNVHKNSRLETPLVVQWLRLRAPNAGVLDLRNGN